MTRIALILLTIALVGFSACPTRREIEVALWLNNGLPSELCEREASLKDYGFYRKLNDGGLEFISFCHPTAREMAALHRSDMKELLDKLLPEKK